jgi:peptidase E
MTKFVLHGGFRSKEKQEDDAFFAEILKDAPEKSTILLVYFADAADRVSMHRNDDISQFEKQKSGKTFSFLVADEEEFSMQIESSNIVYFHGGVSQKLLDVLKQYSNLRALLEGKIVAGDSAGANIFVNMFYSKNADEVYKGLGIIPINLICHYTEAYAHKLDNTSSNFNIMRLSEYQTKIFII